MNSSSSSSSSSCCPPALVIDWNLVSHMNRRQKLSVASAVAAVLLSILLGFLLSFGITHSSTSLLSRLSRDRIIQDAWVTDAVLDRINRQSLREYLAWISRQPHTAGHARDAEIASWILTLFREDLRMDHVAVSTYEVLLSFPTEGRPNKVELMTDTASEVVFSSAAEAGGGSTASEIGLGGTTSMLQNDLFLSTLMNTSLLYPYSAYSPSGEVDGNLVYANYGRQSDFLKLRDLQLPVTDRIVIARLGQIYRGNKVTNAQDFGAKGVILYPDPEDVARQGEGPGDVYPHTDWLPETGVPRGTVMTSDGDPMTPGWPSLPGAYRIVGRSYSLPLIPVQPVSYAAARRLLNCLGGREPPHGWTGRLRGASYRLGGEFTPESGVKKARLVVNNRLANFNVSNVVGVIRGEVEPDRYVIVGAHRDSWGYGAMNPSSATAAVVKVAEAFARTVEETSWRPRRTLVFVSWGAEEFGSVGSSEWVEENLPKLMGRAVAYVNSDVCVSGPDLEATASAALKKVVVEAMRHVRDPKDETRSYYDYWMEARGRGMYPIEMNTAPVIQDLISESDHGPFAFSAGVPAVNVRLANPKHGGGALGGPGGSSFPTHHTTFDNFRLYESVVDPEFFHLQTCARLVAFVARRLADSRVLPYDVEEYGRRMEAGIQALKDSQMFPHNVTLDYLESAVRSFSRQARNWTERVNTTTDFDNPMAVRMLNDQIMALDRIFIMPGGLPTQNGTREVAPAACSDLAISTY